ncbi:MAG: glucose 1-dehydrogenase [Smithellaceae bacterium]|jgi:gluconate 5-dehydrogenase|nr:glucose 1-dehydrogenase [Smithellaceae bacterium]MDD3259143.1 glucose 1-dehydrogenase [Smithellaceae bacterium]MDD3849337.1 glucose 1-dehydrogenase [Smithellaceae bacterium]
MKLTDMFSLKGKVALVTGGGRGIGKFIATGLAEAGADIILTSRKIKNLEATAAELEANQKVKAVAIACDMAKEDTVEAMLKEAVAKFGRIDILVNNAGATWGAPTLDFPLEKWDQLFNVNVRGVWVLTQKVARIMKEQGGGNIINISSVMAFRGSIEEAHPAVPYNSTKAAINLLTMNLAVKLAPHKIRVNAIAPGFFHTDMMAYIDKPEFKPVRDAIINEIPLRRVGEIDDMKGVAVFLASDASQFITGHVMVVDGGQIAK